VYLYIRGTVVFGIGNYFGRNQQPVFTHGAGYGQKGFHFGAYCNYFGVSFCGLANGSVLQINIRNGSVGVGAKLALVAVAYHGGYHLSLALGKCRLAP
jgi:hypothetical protein